MQIEIVQRNGATVVRPAGARVDLQVAADFRAALLEAIEGGHHHLVVDMGGVLFVDSSGLGALVSALKTLKLIKGNGDIRLANVQPPVQALLELIRLHRVFANYPSVDQAVGSFLVGHA